MRASLLTLLLVVLLNPEYSRIASRGDGSAQARTEETKQETCQPPDPVQNALPVNTDRILNNTVRMICKQHYLRKAGTSSLFKCRSGKWDNKPALQCIPDLGNPPPKTTTVKPTELITADLGNPPPKTTTVKPTELITADLGNPPPKTTTVKPTELIAEAQTHTSSPTPTTACISTSEKTTFTTQEQTKSTSATSSIPTWTADHTQRTTPKKEANTTTMNTTATSVETDKTSVTTVSTHSPQTTSISSTSLVVNGTHKPFENKQVIATGTVLILILCAAATAGLLMYRRRSRQQDHSHYMLGMDKQQPATVHPLLNPPDLCSNAPTMDQSDSSPEPSDLSV